MRTALALLAVVGLTGCATTQPIDVALRLDRTDPRFETQACLDARNAALAYNDNVAGRLGVGLAAGVLLGPFGIPFAAAADASQSHRRDALNEEIRRRCTTLPGENDPSPPAPAPATSQPGNSPTPPAARTQL